MLSLQKKILFFLFTHSFLTQKFINVALGNSLKPTYVMEGGCTWETNRDEKGGEGVKNLKFRANVLF